MTSFTVFSWNTAGKQWRTTSIPFSKVLKVLNNHRADVYCLQECYRVGARIKDIQTSKVPMVFIPERSDLSELGSGTVMLSTSTVTDMGHLDFTDLGYKTGGVSWMELRFGKSTVLIYNARLEVNDIGITDRLKMLKKILKHPPKDVPVIVCGDMNTTIPKTGFGRFLNKIVHRFPRGSTIHHGKRLQKDEREYFHDEVKKHGFEELLDLPQATWALPQTSIEFPNLKLDWFLTRNVKAELLELGGYVTDHRYLLARCTVE